MATPDGTVLLVLRNFHRFMGSSEIVQALDTRVVAGRRDCTFVVILSHVVQLPPELERQLVVVDHDLPGKSQIAVIVRGVATEPGELPDGDALAAVLDAAAGLTGSRPRMPSASRWSGMAGLPLMSSGSSRRRPSRPRGS